MIKKFVDRFMENKDKLRSMFSEKHPSSYDDIVKAVVSVIAGDECRTPSANRIHCIDDGDYQGALVYVIAEEGYQPSNYWFIKVYYGSCSGCDTLLGISCCSSDAPTQKQVDEYMTLALHVVQGIKSMQEDE